MPSPSIESLRRELREKFPQAHAFRPESAEPEPAANGWSPASFPAGSLCEIVAGGPACGLGLWISGMLDDPDGEQTPHPQLALIDGADAFDPASFGQAACARLLWVRCRTTGDMLKAADLLARDGNLSLLLLDTVGLPRKDLQACPASAWWRLKRIVEGNRSRIVVMSAFALVPCATRRWRLAADLSLDDFDLPAEALRQRLHLAAERLQRVN